MTVWKIKAVIGKTILMEENLRCPSRMALEDFINGIIISVYNYAQCFIFSKLYGPVEIVLSRIESPWWWE